MKIEFVGGARSVTGSSYILKDKDFTILVDCGMFQGKRELSDRNALPLIYDPSAIDAMLLTHAHIDHSGLIPKLVKEGFTKQIFCTKATADLCAVMLPDSAHIQEMDTKYLNRKNRKLGRDEVKPLYTVDDAAKALKFFTPTDYGKILQIHPRIKVRFRDAGHILGSAIIEMWVDAPHGQKGTTKIVFSGDLGPRDQALIRDPEVIDEADILLIESTYGDRLHKSKEDTYSEFKKIIIDSNNSKGNIIIPSFAIERTQEIIYTLGNLIRANEIPAIPVYIDSPLAISATEIFKKHIDCFDEETRNHLFSGENPLDFPTLKFVRSAEESKLLNEQAVGSIIISANGMCTAGRIKHHLQFNLYKPSANIVFVGFQAEGTLGRRLIEGAKQVRLLGEDIAVRAKIHTLGGFSAHADMNGLLEWLRPVRNPKLKVFVVHGEESSSMHLAEKIRSEFGYEVSVPEWGEIVELSTFRTELADYGKVDSYSTVDREIESLQETLRAFTEQYQRAKAKGRKVDVGSLEHDINDVREMLAMIIDEI